MYNVIDTKLNSSDFITWTNGRKTYVTALTVITCNVEYFVRVLPNVQGTYFVHKRFL